MLKYLKKIINKTSHTLTLFRKNNRQDRKVKKDGKNLDVQFIQFHQEDEETGMEICKLEEEPTRKQSS